MGGKNLESLESAIGQVSGLLAALCFLAEVMETSPVPAGDSPGSSPAVVDSVDAFLAAGGTITRCAPGVAYKTARWEQRVPEGRKYPDLDGYDRGMR